MSENKPTYATIYERIHAVMRDVGYVQKDEKPIDGKYRAVTHDAVIAKLRPALLEHGMLAIPTVDKHEVTATWDKENSSGHVTRWTLTEASVTVSLISVDDPLDRVEVKSFGYGIDNSDKGAGKAISYAVKYALLKAFCLETGDDPDNDQGTDHDQGASRQHGGDRRKGDPGKLATSAQKNMIYDMADKEGMTDSELSELGQKTTGKESSTEYTMGDIDKMMKAIDEWNPLA